MDFFTFQVTIELGKGDYVAHMLPYLRPETIPKG